MRKLSLSIALIAAHFAVAHPGATLAQDLSLRPPLDCILGETCFIQQYVDADPGPGARDHTGGPLSYDGHKGTDFRVADIEAMAEGVPVLAPADGIVRGLRDGMADQTMMDLSAVADRECGNGIAITHGDGWETQLCHLARGSIAVSEGQHVTAGQPVARMGLSGATQFPHVHLSVRRDGETVDPFVENLWATPIEYEPGGLLSAGFFDAIPEFQQVKDGTADASELPTTAPALVVWGAMFGAQAGDVMTLTIEGPDGREFFTSDVALDRTQAEIFRAAGRRLTAPQWREGRYVGTITVTRDGTELDRITTEVTLE